jgi:hypothetical protein
MYITSKIILGAEATRYYDETGEIPSDEELEDMGGIVLEKEFKTKEEYEAYIDALDESDGWDGWVVASENYESPENQTIDDIIKDLLKEGPLVALYFLTGINLLKESIEEMTSEEIKDMFSGLLHPDQVRKNVEHLFEKMNKHRE